MASQTSGMKLSVILMFVLLALVGVVAVFGILWWAIHFDVNQQSIAGVDDQADHIEPSDPLYPSLTDDTLDGKHPRFDPNLVDRRPLAGWEVNQSEAVIRLDSPRIKPKIDPEMLVLRASYSDAIFVMTFGQKTYVHLPSANLLDALAKQFDDGLMGAIELACFEGRLGPQLSTPDWVEAVFKQSPQSSPARPFLAAALQLAGRSVEISDAESEESKQLLLQFKQNRLASKPISFYTWSPELKRLWRFSRFLQRKFTAVDLDVPKAVAKVLEDQSDLKEQYQAICRFQSNLTNALSCLPVDRLNESDGRLDVLAKKHGYRHAATALLPPSTSREVELFEGLFPEGIPDDVNLMTELVRQVRSGEVDLKPDDSSGWYVYQAFALQSLLLPDSNRESDNLLLTATYKRRMIDAFDALLTKRRETHAKHLETYECLAEETASSEDLTIRPRLRLEPCPTFYLRTARAYAFVQQRLETSVGRETLDKIHAISSGGEHAISLSKELGQLIMQFQGFYLISCEDIGMRPEFHEDEKVDRVAAEKAALAKLTGLSAAPELMDDTRVAVPVSINPMSGKTRHWGTLGVRMAHLEASYARPPKVRLKDKPGKWNDAQPEQLESSRYVILVDEFGEFSLGLDTLTREEFRRICDQNGTKEQILEALDR